MVHMMHGFVALLLLAHLPAAVPTRDGQALTVRRATIQTHKRNLSHAR